MKVQTAFYLYDEYPMELVGNTWEFKDINPIYAASTDMNGRFFQSIFAGLFEKGMAGN